MTPKQKINEIEDIIVNQYSTDDERFTADELRSILNAICWVMDQPNGKELK